MSNNHGILKEPTSDDETYISNKEILNCQMRSDVSDESDTSVNSETNPSKKSIIFGLSIVKSLQKEETKEIIYDIQKRITLHLQDKEFIRKSEIKPLIRKLEKLKNLNASEQYSVQGAKKILEKILANFCEEPKRSRCLRRNTSQRKSYGLRDSLKPITRNPRTTIKSQNYLGPATKISTRISSNMFSSREYSQYQNKNAYKRLNQTDLNAEVTLNSKTFDIPMDFLTTPSDQKQNVGDQTEGDHFLSQLFPGNTTQNEKTNNNFKTPKSTQNNQIFGDLTEADHFLSQLCQGNPFPLKPLVEKQQEAKKQRKNPQIPKKTSDMFSNESLVLTNKDFSNSTKTYCGKMLANSDQHILQSNDTLVKNTSFPKDIHPGVNETNADIILDVHKKIHFYLRNSTDISRSEINKLFTTLTSLKNLTTSENRSAERAKIILEKMLLSFDEKPSNASLKNHTSTSDTKTYTEDCLKKISQESLASTVEFPLSLLTNADFTNTVNTVGFSQAVDQFHGINEKHNKQMECQNLIKLNNNWANDVETLSSLDINAVSENGKRKNPQTSTKISYDMFSEESLILQKKLSEKNSRQASEITSFPSELLTNQNFFNSAKTRIEKILDSGQKSNDALNETNADIILDVHKKIRIYLLNKTHVSRLEINKLMKKLMSLKNLKPSEEHSAKCAKNILEKMLFKFHEEHSNASFNNQPSMSDTKTCTENKNLKRCLENNSQKSLAGSIVFPRNVRNTKYETESSQSITFSQAFPDRNTKENDSESLNIIDQTYENPTKHNNQINCQNVNKLKKNVIQTLSNLDLNTISETPSDKTISVVKTQQDVVKNHLKINVIKNLKDLSLSNKFNPNIKNVGIWKDSSDDTVISSSQKKPVMDKRNPNAADRFSKKEVGVDTKPNVETSIKINSTMFTNTIPGTDSALMNAPTSETKINTVNDTFTNKQVSPIQCGITIPEILGVANNASKIGLGNSENNSFNQMDIENEQAPISEPVAAVCVKNNQNIEAQAFDIEHMDVEILPMETENNVTQDEQSNSFMNIRRTYSNLSRFTGDADNGEDIHSKYTICSSPRFLEKYKKSRNTDVSGDATEEIISRAGSSKLKKNQTTRVLEMEKTTSDHAEPSTSKFKIKKHDIHDVILPKSLMRIFETGNDGYDWLFGWDKTQEEKAEASSPADIRDKQQKLTKGERIRKRKDKLRPIWDTLPIEKKVTAENVRRFGMNIFEDPVEKFLDLDVEYEEPSIVLHDKEEGDKSKGFCAALYEVWQERDFKALTENLKSATLKAVKTATLCNDTSSSSETEIESDEEILRKKRNNKEMKKWIAQMKEDNLKYVEEKNKEIEARGDDLKFQREYNEWRLRINKKKTFDEMCKIMDDMDEFRRVRNLDKNKK